jgi:hypothetical protein
MITRFKQAELSHHIDIWYAHVPKGRCANCVIESDILSRGGHHGWGDWAMAPIPYVEARVGISIKSGHFFGTGVKAKKVHFFGTD